MNRNHTERIVNVFAGREGIVGTLRKLLELVWTDSLSAKSPPQTGNSAKINHPGSKKVRTGDIENLLRSLLVPALTWLAVECAVWVGGWVKRGFKVEIQ